jgi:hypothetical protein
MQCHAPARDEHKRRQMVRMFYQVLGLGAGAKSPWGRGPSARVEELRICFVRHALSANIILVIRLPMEHHLLKSQISFECHHRHSVLWFRTQWLTFVPKPIRGCHLYTTPKISRGLAYTISL